MKLLRKKLNWTRQHYTINVGDRDRPVPVLVRGYVSPNKFFGIHKHGKFAPWFGLGAWRITHLRTGLDMLPHDVIRSLPVARDTVLVLEQNPDWWWDLSIWADGDMHLETAKYTLARARTCLRRAQRLNQK